MTLHRIDEPTTDDAEWLAVRYVLGELPPAEAVAFEERLAVDQPAREAVALAVRLTEALAESEMTARTPAETSAPVVALPSRRSRRRLLAIVAAAAVVLLAVVIEAPRSARPVAADDARLAALWSETDAWSGAFEPTVEDDESLAGRDPLLPPDWLIAAVESAPTGPTIDGADQPEFVPGN